MTTYQIVSLIVTILIALGFFGGIGKYISHRMKEHDKKINAVCLGTQALLRDRLIDKYNKFTELGYAPIWAKQNFENMYKQYHNLGVNGVMDEMYHTFIELPTEPPKKEGQ